MKKEPCGAGPLEQPVRRSLVSPVFKICNAYESGYGDGQQCTDGKNAYPAGSDEHEAYQIGYAAGLESEAERQVFNA